MKMFISSEEIILLLRFITRISKYSQSPRFWQRYLTMSGNFERETTGTVEDTLPHDSQNSSALYIQILEHVTKFTLKGNLIF